MKIKSIKVLFDIILPVIAAGGIALLVIPVALFLSAFAPFAQDPGQQAVIFEGSTITTTAQTAITPCGQGNGSIGRKTLSVVNSTNSSGIVTVTAEMRDTQTITNFTSSYLAVNALATGAASSDTVTPDEAAGRFCQVSAVSASTSTITVTLRRE